jgi:hypothetical protein
MTASTAWVTANKASELLGLDKKDLFRMRDDGTLRLGPHFASFPGTYSRDSYRWNVAKVRKELKKQGIPHNPGF